MSRYLLFVLMGFALLTSCVEFDESTYVRDEEGVLHHTKHYKRDYRGRLYFPKQIKATGKKQFVFDPKKAAWAAYDVDGQRVMTGSASGGKEFCDDIQKPCRTVSGTFRVYNKKGPDCKSGEYPIQTEGGAMMPYCMYFYRGFTIHAAYDVPPYNSSHGCIRVLPSAAKWLNEEFIDIGTQVTVLSYADEDGNKDEVASRL